MSIEALNEGNTDAITMATGWQRAYDLRNPYLSPEARQAAGDYIARLLDAEPTDDLFAAQQKALREYVDSQPAS